VAASDLAQLADVKSWLAGSSGIGAGDDAILGRLITDISGAIYAYLDRPSLLPRTITERYDGSGKRRLYVRQYPVLSISSLLVDGFPIPAARTPGAVGSWPQSGYLLEPWDGAPPGNIQAIDVYGNWVLGQPVRSLIGGRQNVVITYTAGYQVSGEAATVQATGPFTIAPQAPWGPWASDAGVTYANGAALTAVNGEPAQGQYAVTLTALPDASPSTWSVAYTFAEADAGAGVLISYGFIPAAINNACIEWVGERYRYRSRIGQSAQTVQGQQTASYSLTGRRTLGMPDFIAASLDPYRRVTPI
jgi:hypothetical protein